ncbi:hypothetical protein [Halarcobacter sp.]|uniref:hypothetical protein n=1 Tax=Halarcobacter sp. TaxID=2321133 RepID=UPI0029F55136|nr:hypothetical protein [Halarcobacter sp.]
MFKYLFIAFLGLSSVFAQESEETTKPSELELFLFKVGFESLLKDVSINSEKSKLNENDIKSLNEKVELILAELYKEKRVLTSDDMEVAKVENSKDNSEVEDLKQQVLLLKKEIEKLKEVKKEKIDEAKTLDTKTSDKKYKTMIVSGKIISIYNRAYPNSKILSSLKKDAIIEIEYCDNFGWCKLANKKEYVKEFLIKEAKTN